MPYGRGTLGALGGMDRPLMVPMGMGMDLPDMASPETPGQRQRGEGYLNWMAEAQRRRALGPQRPMRQRLMSVPQGGGYGHGWDISIHGLPPGLEDRYRRWQLPPGVGPSGGGIGQDGTPWIGGAIGGLGGMIPRVAGIGQGDTPWMGGLTPWLSGRFRRG